MIFIKNKCENLVSFPKNGVNFDINKVHLKLKSELTGKEFIFDDLEDEGEDYLFYKLRVDFSDVDTGEYCYKLDDGQWTATGLLRVGILPKEDTKIYTKKQEIKEYKY